MGNVVFNKLVNTPLSKLEIKDGSNIAVIGGGPAGSFFAYFALDFARLLDLHINIDIFEAKSFGKPGPAGCNHCGGIISESLVQNLSTEGILLPTTVVRRGIESYKIHLEVGSAVIETPVIEKRIASVFRGFGPKGSTDSNFESFDGFLNSICKEKGINVINDKVSKLERCEDGVTVKYSNTSERKYDLVVGSVGLNLNTLQLFKDINPKYIFPKTTKTFISEFYMENSLIDKYFGNSMNVFLLNIPHLKFGALIPKSDYVTLVLLGDQINKAVVDSFLENETVRNCFPESIDPKSLMHCQCYPTINIQGAKSAFDDRIILIGDSASSKLYKNGIGAAYITSKAAARTAIFHGISKNDFENYYDKTCKKLDHDNDIGKFIFGLTSFIQKSNILKKGLYKTILTEQRKTNKERRLSSILWDTFTGSASYSDILQRGLDPRVGASFIWNTIKSIY